MNRLAPPSDAVITHIFPGGTSHGTVTLKAHFMGLRPREAGLSMTALFSRFRVPGAARTVIVAMLKTIDQALEYQSSAVVLASAFQAEEGVPPVPSCLIILPVAAATVWRLAEPTAHPASDGRRGDLKEREKNRHFAPRTPT